MIHAAKPETTSLVLVEEFSHRVLNEYAQAIAGLTVAARRAKTAEARDQLTEAAERLHAQALAHRTLAMPAAEARYDVAEYLARVCAAVANAVLTDAGLCLNVGPFSARLPSGRCWRLALIVSELIHNAARHGGGKGEILVDLSLAGSELVCQVSNGGVCDETANLGRGRRVVVALAEELGGRADWLFSARGACARVVVPVEIPVNTGVQ